MGQQKFDSPFAECRDCGADIVWMKTRAGKNIAVDPDSLRDGENPKDVVYDKKVYRCHWDSCEGRNTPDKDEVQGWPDARK